MRCEREKECFHSNGITERCKWCTEYSENRFWRPPSATNKFYKRKPLKMIGVSEEHIEEFLKERNYEPEAYKEIVEVLLKAEHDSWLAKKEEFKK
ncbi:MAG: hypothetical protein ACRCX2_27920 [Paraclostridium sp.]